MKSERDTKKLKLAIVSKLKAKLRQFLLSWASLLNHLKHLILLVRARDCERVVVVMFSHA